ncbi:arsenate reductase [Sphingomonas spermidinifaciens]|uniref:Arsenate reductase n=1 Tax=Sphingomonas spermidinifaciens TaxID=1141889 RepID=A0A2A4B4K9_9SPHN|nr:arsenate reductase [Sphingomonas spermidinifaciens]PCD02596.1 arsenate reductase [Sphingomonas spermidinifaciens]
MTINLYGIPNCDTVKKARAWLQAAGVEYAFHDYKKAGVDPDRLRHWAGQVGWEKLLNRAGTTFRKLPEGERVVGDLDAAVALMATHSSLIKRPVVEHDGGLLVGFAPDRWDEALRSREAQICP